MNHCDSSDATSAVSTKCFNSARLCLPQVPITVAHGDGIGPEIMESTLRILESAGAGLDIDTIDIGEKLYLQGE